MWNIANNICLFLMDVNTRVTLDGKTPTATAAAGATVVENATEAAGSGGFFQALGQNQLLTIVLYIVFIFGVIYFLTIRPGKKQEEKLKQERANIKIGDTVVLSSGMYGIVTDIFTDVFIVEFGTNKNIRIPVAKSQVIAAKTPNLTNKPEEAPAEPEKKGFFARLRGDK